MRLPLVVLADALGSHHALAPSGPQAGTIARLWWLYLAVVAVVCLLVVLAVLLAIARRRSRSSLPEAPALADTARPAAEPARALRTLDPARERRALRFVTASAAASAIALALLFVESVVTANRLEALPKSDALHVEVVAQQWWWEVRYPDSNPSLQAVTANEIHIPVGRTVVFQLNATDVIHSFWVPSLHGKGDLIPGRPTSLALRADRAGVYRGQCAEFCGNAHAFMAFSVVAEPPARFDAWLTRQRAAPAPPATPAEQRGQQVFLNGPCSLCHTVAGTTAQGHTGPDLSHVASRSALAAESFPNRRGWLAAWLLDSQHLKPGNHMPAVTVPPADLHALIAYLESLR